MLIPSISSSRHSSKEPGERQFIYNLGNESFSTKANTYLSPGLTRSAKKAEPTPLRARSCDL